MQRPSTSSRPYTSSGEPPRPTTSGPGYPDFFDRDQQYTANSQDQSIDEEDEESDDEDVFAFGPPGTADQEAHTNTSTVSPTASPTVSFPPPTFDPASPYFAYNTAGPSSLHSRHPYPMSPQVETPPSTDSQSGDDPYRMRRIGQTVSTPATTHTGKSGVSSAVSSREVRVSLPRTKDRIEEDSGEDPQKARPPSSATSFPSLDSAAASIKYASVLSSLTWY